MYSSRVLGILYIPPTQESQAIFLSAGTLLAGLFQPQKILFVTP